MTQDKQTILIVDDSRTNIMALADLLKGDWAIKIATNGKDALRIALTRKPPDIILLDVMMPEMDGYEVCEKLKNIPETKDIPIIFVSAMNQPKDEEYGLSLGAIDYITKPIRPAVVKIRVKNHLELKKYRDLLKEHSMVDGLTGVPNRRRFDETLAVEWKRAIRDRRPLSLVMIDIDFFKKFNDTYGHLEGDECLKKVANAMQAGLKRPLDMLARWGGEEFACILPETDQAGAYQIAEELRQRIENLKIPHESSLITDIVTVSLGVTSLVPTDLEVSETLVERADKALYGAKEKGRNRVEVYKDK